MEPAAAAVLLADARLPAWLLRPSEGVPLGELSPAQLAWWAAGVESAVFPGRDDPRPCASAAAAGNLAALRWLRARGHSWDEMTVEFAAGAGSIPVLRWAREEAEPPAPWGPGAPSEAAMAGQLEALRWLRARGCPWFRAACEAQALGALKRRVVCMPPRPWHLFDESLTYEEMGRANAPRLAALRRMEAEGWKENATEVVHRAHRKTPSPPEPVTDGTRKTFLNM